MLLIEDGMTVTCSVRVSDLNVRLSTWCHFVRPKVSQSDVRRRADVNSQRLQTQQRRHCWRRGPWSTNNYAQTE